MVLLCIPYPQAATPLSPTGALVLTYLDGFHIRTWAESLLRQPWEGPIRDVPSSESLIWVLPCRCTPVLWACEADGSPVMGLETARAGCCLPFRICHCLFGLIRWCADKLLSYNPIMEV